MKPVSAADLVPHSDRMALLDDIVDWQDESLHGRSRLAPPAEHPLADAEGLPASILIEYAAQATAAHGTLLAGRQAGAGSSPAPGRLVALRDVELLSASRQLHDVTALDVHVERLHADASGAIYQFRVLTNDQRLLVRGRLSIHALQSWDA